MIWLAWIGCAILLISMIAAFIALLLEGNDIARGAVICLFVGVPALFITWSVVTLDSHYFPKKEPQKLECTR